MSKEGDAEPDGQRPVMDGKSGELEGNKQLSSGLVNNRDFLCRIRKIQPELQM
jgi:hypothetical protein